jgi:thiamine-phosphate pyrophosphorylase
MMTMMMRTKKVILKSLVISGLYAVTPNELNTAELLRKVRAVLQGGATVLQYRNKQADKKTLYNQALALRDLTREFGALYLINDHPELAAQVDADGVHLGGEDGSVAAARHCLGAQKIIGVSCYNRQELARAAVAQGADYLAFGAFFSSSIKPNAVRAEADILRWARQQFSLPLVAIGGITLVNGASLLDAGANSLAVISALFDVGDPKVAAQQFSTLIQKVQHDIA